MVDNPYKSLEYTETQKTSSRSALIRWSSLASLSCSIASVVAQVFYFSFASYSMITVAEGKGIPRQSALIADWLNLLAAVLVSAALIFGIPSVWKDSSVFRFAVLCAFIVAVMFLFVIV